MGSDEGHPADPGLDRTPVSLPTIAREWGRIGITGFGGPPTHIALLRRLTVERHEWLSSSELEDGRAAVNMLPGPASTQLSIFAAWRLRGVVGALVGGFCFIVPGLVQTVAVVGYAAGGVPAGLLAALCAFSPSFLFVIAGGRHFDRLRADRRVQSFLTGAATAAIGAIAGSALPLGLALQHVWEIGVLGVAFVWLVLLRRGVVTGLAGAAALGVIAVLAGAPG